MARSRHRWRNNQSRLGHHFSDRDGVGSGRNTPESAWSVMGALCRNRSEALPAWHAKLPAPGKEVSGKPNSNPGQSARQVGHLSRCDKIQLRRWETRHNPGGRYGKPDRSGPSAGHSVTDSPIPVPVARPAIAGPATARRSPAPPAIRSDCARDIHAGFSGSAQSPSTSLSRHTPARRQQVAVSLSSTLTLPVAPLAPICRSQIVTN
jgi:hypothetical protein